MSAFDAPGRGLGRGRRVGWKIPWGNGLANGLSFLFVPWGLGYIDLVRGDVAYLVQGLTNPYQMIQSPVGPTWWLSKASTSKTGYAATRNNDPYYMQSNLRGTIMCGGYNIETGGGQTTHTYAAITNPVSNNGSFSLFDTTTPTRLPEAGLGGGGGATGATAPGSGNVQTAGWGFTMGATYDGATLTAWYQNQNYNAGGGVNAATTGSNSVSRNPSVGTNQVRIGVDVNNNYAFTTITWLAGWFGTQAIPRLLSSAQFAAIATFNNQIGRLPTCLAVRKGFSHL